VQDRTEPVAVDTVVTGEWIITLNADRAIYRDGAIAVSGGVIAEVGKRAAILAKYRPATLVDEPGSIVIPGMINGHRHLLCCAKGAMPEGGQTLSALRQFIYPSFAALTEDDMHVYARHAAAEMIRFGTTLFEEPGCNHLEAVLEALAASGIRARTGPWTWDQAGPASADGLPDWLRMDADATLERLAQGIETIRKFNHPRSRTCTASARCTTGSCSTT
jgi:cytosine/adenosine deaminase-related metal-dependent hydrolase